MLRSFRAQLRHSRLQGFVLFLVPLRLGGGVAIGAGACRRRREPFSRRRPRRAVGRLSAEANRLDDCQGGVQDRIERPVSSKQAAKAPLPSTAQANRTPKLLFPLLSSQTQLAETAIRLEGQFASATLMAESSATTVVRSAMAPSSASRTPVASLPKVTAPLLIVAVLTALAAMSTALTAPSWIFSDVTELLARSLLLTQRSQTTLVACALATSASSSCDSARAQAVHTGSFGFTSPLHEQGSDEPTPRVPAGQSQGASSRQKKPRRNAPGFDGSKPLASASGGAPPGEQQAAEAEQGDEAQRAAAAATASTPAAAPLGARRRGEGRRVAADRQGGRLGGRELGSTPGAGGTRFRRSRSYPGHS